MMYESCEETNEIITQNSTQFLIHKSDSSSQATIRPKFQKATIRPIWKSDNSSQLLKTAISPRFNFQSILL